MISTQTLRELAEKATQKIPTECGDGYDRMFPNVHALKRLHSAASPSTILAMLDVIEAAKAIVDMDDRTDERFFELADALKKLEAP